MAHLHQHPITARYSVSALGAQALYGRSGKLTAFIFDFMSKDNRLHFARPVVPALMEHTGLSRPTVKRHLKELADQGVITTLRYEVSVNGAYAWK